MIRYTLTIGDMLKGSASSPSTSLVSHKIGVELGPALAFSPCSEFREPEAVSPGRLRGFVSEPWE
jgi:hypothetical protein